MTYREAPPRPDTSYDPLRGYIEEVTGVSLTPEGIRKRFRRMSGADKVRLLAMWVACGILLALPVVAGSRGRVPAPVEGTAVLVAMALVYGAVRVWENAVVKRELRDAPLPADALRQYYLDQVKALRAKLSREGQGELSGIAPKGMPNADPIDTHYQAEAIANALRQQMTRIPQLTALLQDYERASHPLDRASAFLAVTAACEILDYVLHIVESAHDTIASPREFASWPEVNLLLGWIEANCGALPPEPFRWVVSGIRLETPELLVQPTGYSEQEARDRAEVAKAGGRR